MKKSRVSKIFLMSIVTVLILGVLSLGFVGCKSKDKKGASKIIVRGSTSMEKVMKALIGEYNKISGKKVDFDMELEGSGVGRDAVKVDTKGNVIGMASSNTKEADTKFNAKKITLCQDGIAVIVNTKNTGIKSLTIEQVFDIYAKKITNWNELGGEDKDIVVCEREASSGTRDAFGSVIKSADGKKLKDAEKENGAIKEGRETMQKSGDLLQKVANTEAAIGYVSLNQVNDTVKALEIGDVAGSEETVQNGTYKLARPFEILYNKDVELTEATKDFIKFLESKEAQAIVKEVGLVSNPEMTASYKG